MELYSYAWFIYTLTILLVLSILFIIILIIVKCLQACWQTRFFCFKQKIHHRQNCQRLIRQQQRRERRRRRQRNEIHSTAFSNNSTLSSLSSCSCSSLSSFSSSSSDSDIEVNNIMIYENSSNSNFSSIHLWNSYDNKGFSNAFDIDVDFDKLEIGKKSNNDAKIVNRKYDDRKRYKNNFYQERYKNGDTNKHNLKTIAYSQIMPELCSLRETDNELSSLIKNFRISKSFSSISNNDSKITTLNQANYLTIPSDLILPSYSSFLKNKCQSACINVDNRPTTFKEKLSSDVNDNFLNFLENQFNFDQISNFSTIIDENDIPPCYNDVIKESRV